MSNSFYRAFLRLLVLGLLALQLSACGTPPAAPTGLSAAQVSALQENGFQQTDDGWELSFADKLLFESDSSTLAGKSHAAVEKIGKALIGVGIERLRVEGHTDNVGSDAYNNKLSLARAEAVANVLNSTGIASSNLTVRGLGKSKPVADNATASGRMENRRVTIIVSAP